MSVLKNTKIEIIESLRGFAAIYVVVHHFIGFTELKTALPSLIHFPFRFGQEIVMLFFLMSGFVIYAANQDIETKKFSDYIAKRFSRIYPIFILSLLVSLVVLHLNGDKLTFGDIRDLLGNLAMFQDTGNKPGPIVYPFLKNYPLWSLSYEWWFYVIFFPLSVFFTRSSAYQKTPNIYFVLLISVISYLLYMIVPNHMLLILSHLIIWWSGIYLSNLFFDKRRFSLTSLKPIYFSLLTMTFISAIPLIISFINDPSLLNPNDYPVIDFRHFLSTLIIVFIGQVLIFFKASHFQKLIKPFSKLAPISYAMYCIHFPIILLNTSFIQNLYIEYIFKLLIVIIISYVFEMIVQPNISRMLLAKKNSKLKVVHDHKF